MDYAQWITKMRNMVGDTYRRKHIDFVGDGTTTVFQMPTGAFPVLDDSSTYTIKKAGSTQTEDTDYEFDKEAGTIVTATAPAINVALTSDHIAVHVTDEGWMQITNDVIRSLGKDFFIEFVDGENLFSTAGMLTVDVTDSQDDIFAIYDFWYRDNDNEDWRVVEELCNWRYDPENFLIHLGNRDAFTQTGKPLKIRGLRRFALGSALDVALDVPDRFHSVIEYGCAAKYYEYRYKEVIELVTKTSTETTRTPLQELMMLVDRYNRMFADERARLKPAKPARILPAFKWGGGRP